MGGPYESDRSYDNVKHSSEDYLKPIAYDGTTHTDTDGILVSDWNTLTSTLVATVAAPVVGNVLSGNSALGGDGGWLKSVTLEGNTFSYDHANGTVSASGGAYSYNAATHTLTITDSHQGVLVLNLEAGNYTYQPYNTMVGSYSQLLNVTVSDYDGDTAAGTVTLDVARALGAAGNNTIAGTTSPDVLIGGGGSDTLTGGAGADVFRWTLGDAAGSPTDTVTDFNLAAKADGGDVLDFRDLLVGESHVGTDVGNLDQYLHFSYAAGTGTTIQVTTHDASSSVQNIVLQNVDLTAGMVNSDQQIIQDLLTKGKLLTD